MTGTQRKIIQRLLAGERLRRYSKGGNLYAWSDEHGRRIANTLFVNHRTLRNMFHAGLLRVAALPGESESRYIPTDIAAFEVKKNVPR